MNSLQEVRTLKEEFDSIVEDIVNNETVQQMHNYIQHCKTDCFEHCQNVAFYSFIICKKYNLDYKAVARAGMIHDLFLYDWRKRQPDRKGLHAFTHPKTSLENATKLFNLNDKEKDIILKHMWPVTFWLPKYKESYVITFVDKYCAMEESFNSFKENFKTGKMYKYAHILAGALLFIKK